MKKLILLLCIVFSVSAVKSQVFFQSQVKKSASGNSLEFYIRPNFAGGNINLKFDNLDFFIRVPSAEVPITGTPVVNTVDFPGLTIAQQVSDDPYGAETGFIIREWTSPLSTSTNTAVNYVAGQEYLVFSVPVSNVISSNIEMAGNNEVALPYYFTATKNTPGSGQSDFTSHNSTNGDINNQLFYGSAAFLSRSGQNFYQKITSSVLPVKFITFTAVKKYDDAVLTWAVANETAEVDHYEIERSANGTTFSKINSFAKTINGNSVNIYSYADKNVATIKSNGIIYYRIKQLDVDGKFVYSEVRSLKVSDTNQLVAVYPNPVENETLLEINAPSDMAINYSIIASDGKILQTNSLKAVKGTNSKIIEMKSYRTGSYILRLMIGSEIKTMQIIKK